MIMASAYVKKPRNVRSVYARPVDAGAVLTGTERDNFVKPINHSGNESTRGKRGGRKSTKANGSKSTKANGSIRPVKCDSDVGGCSPQPKSCKGNKKLNIDDGGVQSAKPDSESSESASVSAPVAGKPELKNVANKSAQSDSEDCNAGRESGEIVMQEDVKLTQSESNVVTRTEFLESPADAVKPDSAESACKSEKCDNVGVCKDSDSSRSVSKNHVCEVCQKTFLTSKALKSHSKAHSSVETVGKQQQVKRRRKKNAELLVCGHCNKVFKKASEFSRHKVIHSGEKPFVCSECGMGFTQSGNLKNHQIIHTGKRPFACDVCNKTFIRNGDLKTHKMIHTGEKPFVCDICKKAFITRDYLNSHKLIHTDHKPFVCDQCNMCFRKSSQLKAHLERHIGAKNFVCEVCSKAFSTKGILKTHMLIHTGHKTYVCHICAATLTRESSLKKHMMIHNNERPYVCSVCNKGYIVKSEWEIHMRTHTGERPFICSICPATFARNANLQQHMNAVHLGKRPYVCEVCEKAFTERRSLKEHKLIHTGERPHKCSVCRKGFTQSSSLKTHMRIHSGDKPFLCDYCPKRFSDIGSRNRHHRTHTGEMPYKCSQCPAAFSRSEQYKNHLQSTHSDCVSETVDSIQQPSANNALHASVTGDGAEKNVGNTASSLSGDMSSGPAIVVQAVVFEDSAFNTSSDLPSDSAVVQPVDILDNSALNTAGDILSGQTIVVKSMENLHDTSSAHAPDCQTSVEEHYIFPPGTTVIYQSIPPNSSSHLGSSGSEFIEYTVIEEPATSDLALTESQFSHEDDVSGTVIIEPQMNEQIIEVQGNDQGLPPHIIKLKVENGTTTPGLSIVESEIEHEVGFSGSVAEDMEVDYSENARTLAVIESQADSDVYPSDMAADDLDVDHTENTTGVTVIESHSQTDIDDVTSSAVGQLHADHAQSSSPKMIDMQHVENIQIIKSGSVVDVKTVGDHYSTIRDLLKKPLLESTDQSPNYMPPLVKASNTNKKAHKNTKPTLIVADPEASALSDAAKKRKRKFGQTAKNWICEICGNGFTQRCSLRKHIAVQHNTGNMKSLICDICSKPCASKSELDAHKRSHTGDRPFTCRLCNNSYKHKADLQQHFLAGHLGERPHVCDVCQRAFTEKRSLKDHKLIHEGVKPHKCLTCGKAFTQSSSLKNHQRVHTGLKPWVCQYCGKDFCDHSTFNRHQRIHTGEKPHQCPQCPRAFARSEQLKKHKNREHPGNLQNLATLAAVATIS